MSKARGLLFVQVGVVKCRLTNCRFRFSCIQNIFDGLEFFMAMIKSTSNEKFLRVESTFQPHADGRLTADESEEFFINVYNELNES